MANVISTDDAKGFRIRGLGREKLLTAEEEIELFKRMEEGDETARNRLLNANIRLVALVVKNYAGGGQRFFDLFQEGSMGLIRAVEKFDWRKGFRFSTYAAWWIRQAIIRAAPGEARSIYLPSHITRQINKVARVSHGLAQSLGREPTDTEIAGSLGWETRQVVFIKNAALKPVSLDTPASEEEDAPLASVVADKNAEDPVDAAVAALLREEIARVLSILPARERNMVRMRFGLDDGCPQTLEDVSRCFKVSRERVRQIEVNILRRLRHPEVSGRLREYLEFYTP
jgi:RNA polymerase primary sigma factor